MKIKVIKTEQEYAEACSRIYDLMHGTDADILPESKEGEELELLSLLVDDYEQRMNYKLDAPDAIDVIKIKMKEQHLRQSDLTKYLGSKSTVSKIMRKQRSLTLEMVRKLSKGLGLPAEILIG